MKLSSQRYQILYVLHEKQFPITSWPRDPFGVQQPTKGQKPDIGSMANIDHHKIFFPLTPNLIAFVSKYFSPMTS